MVGIACLKTARSSPDEAEVEDGSRTQSSFRDET
jgi:hypothetical protein